MQFRPRRSNLETKVQMARPPLDIDPDQVSKLASINCTMIETWREVDGFTSYWISDQGRLRRSLKRGGFRILKTHSNGNGYTLAALFRNKIRHTFLAHRVVANAFIPNPMSLPVINHLNGDKSDNRAANLEWTTPSGNAVHAHATGLAKGRAVTLTAEVVRQIRQSPHGSTSCGREFGVSKTTIQQIRNKRTWKHV